MNRILLLETLRNSVRHPFRFALLFLGILVSATSTFLIFSSFRTVQMLVRPTLPEDVWDLSFKFAKGARADLSPQEFLRLNRLEGVWVAAGRPLVGSGLSFTAYGFGNSRTLQAYNPDKSLLEGRWPAAHELVLARAGCRILGCRVGSPLRLLEPGTQRVRTVTVSGLLETPDSTVMLTVPPLEAREVRQWHFWLKPTSEATRDLESRLDRFMTGRGWSIEEDSFIDDRFSEADFAQRSHSALLKLFVPIAGVALFACALIVVFNFAVNRLERAREIAIKRAYGASSGQLFLESLLEALGLLLLTLPPCFGLVAWGLKVFGASEAGKFVQTLLYFDLETVLLTALCLGGLVLLSALIPTWATLRMAPSPLLREE